MAITQSQIDVCNSPIHNKKIRIEVLDNYFKIVSSIESEAVSGSISIDANNDCRRSCSLTVAVPNVFSFDSFIPDDTYKIQLGGKIWLDRNIKIWLGIQNLATEEYEWFNMGIYLIDEPIQTFGAETNTISFNGIDIIKRLDSTRGGQLASLTTTIPQYQDANNTVRTTLRKAFESVLLDLGNIEDYVISSEIDNPIWRYLPYDISVGAGETVYTLLCALRDIPSNWEMFFDENGTFVVQPIPSGIDEVTVPITTEIISQDSVVIDFNNVKNQIIVYGGLNEISRYTETVTYTAGSSRLNLYFDDFGWGNFNIGSKIGFKNRNEYNTFNITNVSIYVGTELFAGNIPIVGSENTTPNIPSLFLEPDEIYVVRFMTGDVDSEGRILGTNLTFDLYSRQQPRYTAVETNKESEFYINNYVRKPNYYGGQSKSTGFVYQITINDENEPINSLPNDTYLTFMPNIITGSYQWKTNNTAIGTSATNNFTSVAYGEDKCVATFGNVAYKSLDGGTTWSQITGITISNAKVVYWRRSSSYKYFVIAGNNTLYVCNMATSADLSLWTSLSSGYNYPLSRDISQLDISDDNLCVVVGYKTGNQIFQLRHIAFDGPLNGYVITLPSGDTTPIGSLGHFYSFNTGYVSDTTGQIYFVALAQSSISFLHKFNPNSLVYTDFYCKAYADGYGYSYSTGSSSIVKQTIFANGLWVSVASNNKIFTSTDAINWNMRLGTFGATEQINTVVYGGDKFVSGGNSGGMSISSNGIIWSSIDSSFGTTAINKIAHNGTMFVAVGGLGKTAISYDGSIWTQVSSVFGTTTINDVFAGNGIWVAVGNEGRLATSIDGINWTLRTSSFSSTNINTGTFGGGMFIVGGNDGKVATSTNGTTWTQVSGGVGTIQHITSAFYGNNQFFLGAINNSDLFISNDGIVWSTKSTYLSNGRVYSIFWASGKLVININRYIHTKYTDYFALLSTSELFVNSNINNINAWSVSKILNSTTYRGGIFYNDKLYLYGTDSVVGNFIIVSNNAEWSAFTDISRTFYNNNASRLYTYYLAPSTDRLVGISATSLGGVGYFTEQVSSTADIVYRLLVYSSSNSSVPIAEGEIVTRSLTSLPYGKFTNDYSIQIVKWDSTNERFIYQGVLNNYLKVNVGDDFENIPTDDLCRQRADYELYLHSNTNNSITLNIVPNYYLNVHNRIKYNNPFKDANLSGDNYYLIKSLTIPVTDLGAMSLTAIQLYDGGYVPPV